MEPQPIGYVIHDSDDFSVRLVPGLCQHELATVMAVVCAQLVTQGVAPEQIAHAAQEFAQRALQVVRQAQAQASLIEQVKERRN